MSVSSTEKRRLLASEGLDGKSVTITVDTPEITPPEEASIEAYRLGENIDNAVIMMNFHDIVYHRKGHHSEVGVSQYTFSLCWLGQEVFFLVLSTVLRLGAACYLYQAANSKGCKASSVDIYLVLGGVFLWAMSRLQYLFDILEEVIYFGKMYLAGSRLGSTSSVSMKVEHEPFNSGWGFFQTIMILGFKCFVEVFVGYAGGYFIIVSEQISDVILNCLAAEFISDIDESIYKHFSSPFAKKLVQSAPRMPPRDEREIGRLVSSGTVFVKWVVFVVAPIGTHAAYYWLPSCQNADN